MCEMGKMARQFEQSSNLLSNKKATISVKEMARRGGFEPPTPRFVVWCSIQLSYRRLCLRRCRGMIWPVGCAAVAIRDAFILGKRAFDGYSD